MKRVVWISAAVLTAIVLVVGTATARKYKSSRHHDHGAFLGVSTESVDSRLADRRDLPVEFGALIDRVYNDTPADDVGLQRGDIVVEFNGTKVRDSEDLSDLLDDLNSGDEAKLVVRRNQDTVGFTVTLGDQDDFLKDFHFPSNVGALVAPRAPKVPQAFWFDPHRAYIGIGMMDLTRQLGDYFGVTKARGVLVTEVEKNSPAEAAGLKAGDIVIRLDGDRVFDSDDIQDIVSESKAGDKLKVGIMRDKKEMEVELTVDERDGDYNYDNRWGSFSIPDIPDVNVVIPNGNQFWYGDDDNVSSFYHNSRGFRDEMGKLKDELKELQDELHQELRDLDVH